MGQSGSHIADIVMDEVRVGGEALLGGELGKGFVYAMMSLDNGRMSVGAAATASARRTLHSAVHYATERIDRMCVGWGKRWSARSHPRCRRRIKKQINNV